MKSALWQFGSLVCLAAAMSASAAHSYRHLAGNGGSGQESYMWVDEKGQRHYGDAVPGEYSQQERRVLNRQGVEVRREGTRKSEEQLVAEQQQNNDTQQRVQHDRFLLTTYTSTRDIERLRDERISQINGQIVAAVAYIDTLDVRLKAMQDRAMRFKPYNPAPGARRMPDELVEELVRGTNEGRAQRQSLDNRRKEIDKLREQFDTDIERYKVLTRQSRGVPAAVPVAGTDRRGS